MWKPVGSSDLFFARAAERQGYLANSSNLWTIAGAKRRDFWESHKSRVLACFEVRDVDGTEYLCFPPLLKLINQQAAALQEARQTHAPHTHTHRG